MFSKISELLSDPQAAQKIQQIASSLSSGEGMNATSGEDAPEAAETLSLPEGEGNSGLLSGIPLSGGHSRELALLHAVRPYLRASRAGKIDRAVKAIRVIDFLSNLR